MIGDDETTTTGEQPGTGGENDTDTKNPDEVDPNYSGTVDGRHGGPPGSGTGADGDLTGRGGTAPGVSRETEGKSGEK